MNKIAVLGSINMDFKVRVNEFPKPGQTISVTDLSQSVGGKGANQSVTVAKLGNKVNMFGALGDGYFSEKLRKELWGVGVDISEVEVKPTQSGLAFVLVDNNGENKILVVGGANQELRKSYINKIVPKLKKFEILLLQLEIPVPVIRFLLEKLDAPKPKVILDPAPAKPLDKLDFQMKKIDLWTPNETELNALLPNEVDGKIEAFMKKGAKRVIMTRAEYGAEYVDPKKRFTIDSYNVNDIDSTAAGDAFNGALAVALSRGYDYEQALRFANAAGALATTKKGAKPSLPTEKEVKELIEKNKKI